MSNPVTDGWHRFFLGLTSLFGRVGYKCSVNTFVLGALLRQLQLILLADSSSLIPLLFKQVFLHLNVTWS